MSKTSSAVVSGDLRYTVPSTPRGPLGPVDRRLLRGAGLTGTVGSLLMLATFVLVGALGLPDPSTPDSLLRFPEIQYALLNVATATMSQAYQQAAEADRSVVVLAWQAAQGVMDALLVTGALLLPAAVVLFGIALRRGLSPILGWGAVVVGTAGTAAAIAAATNLPSLLVAVSILGTLTFHLVTGISWLRLSRS